MNTVLSRNTSVAIWQRAIQPARRNLSEAAARAFASLKIASRDLARADALATKAAEGTLSDAEARELDDYRSVGTALEFLKSKSRASLGRARKAM